MIVDKPRITRDREPCETCRWYGSMAGPPHRPVYHWRVSGDPAVFFSLGEALWSLKYRSGGAA
jgi:hypothetical protein